MKRYLSFLLACMMLMSILSGCVPMPEAEVTTIPTQPSTGKPTEPTPTNPSDPEPSEPVAPEPGEPVEPEPSEPTDPEPSEPVEPTPEEHVTVAANGAVMIAKQVPEEILHELEADYLDWWKLEDSVYFPYWPIFAVYDNRYYVCCRPGFKNGWPVHTEVINGLQFRFVEFLCIKVYEAGNSYSLSDAFALGILNEEQLQEIHDRYQMFNNYALANRTFFIMDEE